MNLIANGVKTKKQRAGDLSSAFGNDSFSGDIIEPTCNFIDVNSTDC
jgi:hypothetical protein